MKERKFIILGLSVFFLFLFLGKYFQEHALSSTDLIYTTHVIRKSNQEEVTFQVQRTEENTYIVKNVTTGEVASADSSQFLSHTHIRIGLPNDEGTLELRQSLLPWKRPELTLQRSTVYRQVENSSSAEKANGYSLESSETLSATPVSGLQEISLSDSQINKVANEFAKWLYDSHYGENSVVVKGQFDDPVAANETAEVLYVQTEDGDLFTRLIGADGETISELSEIKVGSDVLSGSDGLLKMENFNLYQLGVDPSTDKVSDVAPKTVIRLYRLVDSVHANYDTDAEKRNIIEEKVPSSERVAYRNYGYSYLYEELVDSSQESMQIVLGTNGKVYYTTNYWLEGNPSGAIQTYELAPSDMQTAFQNLLVEVGSSQTSSSSQ